MVKAYANIKLPEELVREVDKLIKNGSSATEVGESL